MINTSTKRNLSRSVSLVVLVSILTFGLSFADGRDYQASSGVTRMLTDSAAVLTVGGSEDTSCLAGLALIAIGMSGILGSAESLAIIAAGILLLLGPCLC